MWYYVTLELPLYAWYQTVPLEGISENDRLHTDIGYDNNISLVNPVKWADPDTHKPRRWKASSSPKVIYVVYIPTMFAKHYEQVN